MEVAVTDASQQLTDLVRRAEAGEEIVLTQDGRPAATLRSAVRPPHKPLTADEVEARYQAVLEISKRAAAKAALANGGGSPSPSGGLPPDLAARRLRLLDLSAEMASKKTPGPDAAHASDFLFDEFGLPG